MIKSFQHKGLKQLFEKGSSAKINAQQRAKCIRQMDALDVASKPDAMNVPGWDFHGLEGKPKRYSVSVTGNWRITFGWKGEDATHVNLEDYH
jgi:proteic killer suppression protein